MTRRMRLFGMGCMVAAASLALGSVAARAQGSTAAPFNKVTVSQDVAKRTLMKAVINADTARAIVDACVELLWKQIGLDRADPSTWVEPVCWVGGMSQPPFVQAMNSLQVLEACDRLAGPGKWKPRTW